MMRARILIIYLFIAMALGTLYFYEIFSEKSKKSGELDENILFPIDPSEITEITLISSTNKIILRRGKTTSNWDITFPINSAADSLAITSVLDALVHLRMERVISDVSDNLALFGLNHPSLTVAFLAKGARHKLVLGNETPLKDSVYGKTSESTKIFTISNASKHALTKSLFDLRDKRLFTIAPNKVIRLAINWKGKKPWIFIKKGSLWHLEGSPSIQIDGNRLESLIKRLTWTRIASFEKCEPKGLDAFGLLEPAVSVSISDGQRAETILLGSRPKNSPDYVYAMLERSSQVVTIKNWLASELPRTKGDLKK